MKRKFNAVLALALAVCLCLGAVPAAAASEAAFTAEEVIYARLDATGAPKEGYAVVALNVSQAGTVTHYGDYSSVVNLSDSTPISYSEGEVTLDAAAGRSYYEGTLSEVELPWNIEISYKLDGKAVAPEELGGASGQLEIAIKTSKNEAVSGGFYDNYLLQFTITLDADLCENVVVTGGTAANAGGSKTVSLMVLPGSDGDVGLTADVRDFRMDGMTIAAVPYDVADSLGDMSEVTDGLGQLVDAISQLSDGASQLSSGASQLRSGASQYGSGLTELAAGSAQLTEASDKIAESLAQVGSMGGQLPSGGTVSLSSLTQLPGALRQLKAGLDQISSGIDELSEGYSAAYTALSDAIGSIPAAGVTEEDIAALMTANPDSAALASLIANYQAAQTVKGTWEQTKAAFAAVQQNLPTFSKSLASLGGYMAASELVCDYVRHNSRPFIFSASIPPSACAAALAALRLLRERPELPRRLLSLASYARAGLKARGLRIIESETPIIPIYTYEMENTLTSAKRLYDAGVYVNPVLPPAAAPGECLLRVSCMATHTEALLDEAMDIIAEVLGKDEHV